MRLSKFARYLCVFCSVLLVGFLIDGCGGGSKSSSSGSGSGSGSGGGSTPAVSITTGATLTAGVVGVAYNTTLAATGGNGTYSWSVSAGSLPAGLALNATTGAITGTPTAAGSSSFTIQVADTESTPQKATLAATLVINPPLSITTTTLPAGQQNVAYSQQLAATGGVSPYTWSLATGAQLPAGLTLSSAGVISGTPTGFSSTSFGVVVTDSSKTTATATLSLLITPQTGSIPDGTYAFMFAGTTPQGSSQAENAVAINGTFTVSSGKVVSGFYDENTNTGPAVTEQAITGGSIVNGTNGLGQLSLTVSSGTMGFALASPASAAPGKDSAIQMIAFTDTNGSGTRGSGVLKPSAPVAATTGITGNFAFQLSGSDLNQKQQALMGSFATNGSGTISSGVANSNEEGTLRQWDTVTGTYTVDNNGRGLLKLQLGLGLFSYSFYEVSPTEWMVISVDQATSSSPLVSGWVLQQSGAPFSVASLPSTAVFHVRGLQTTSAGIVPDIVAGIATSDGTGKVSYTYDEYNGKSTTNTWSMTYTVDPATGRALPGDPTTQPILYIINNNSAFILGAESSANIGILEAQSGGPFANASFKGNYLGGSLPLVSTSVLNESGLVAADGNGNVVLTTNRSTSSGLVQYQVLNATYAADSTGKVTVTAPDGVVRIFLIVSPTKVIYFTTEAGGYIGSFEQ